MAVRQLSDGAPDGQSLGQSTSDKVSLYGVAPIAQRAGAAQATSLVGTASSTAVNTNTQGCGHRDHEHADRARSVEGLGVGRRDSRRAGAIQRADDGARIDPRQDEHRNHAARILTISRGTISSCRSGGRDARQPGRAAVFAAGRRLEAIFGFLGRAAVSGASPTCARYDP